MAPGCCYLRGYCYPRLRAVSRTSLLAMMLLIGLVVNAPIISAAPQLSSDTELSTVGYFSLSWSAPAGSATHQYELQQADNAAFTDAITRYRGPDEATVISGLPNNHYYYRVRLEGDDEWSESIKVDVEHHPLSRAFSFFALGAVMFVVTVVVLVAGVRGRGQDGAA